MAAEANEAVYRCTRCGSLSSDIPDFEPYPVKVAEGHVEVFCEPCYLAMDREGVVDLCSDCGKVTLTDELKDLLGDKYCPECAAVEFEDPPFVSNRFFFDARGWNVRANDDMRGVK